MTSLVISTDAPTVAGPPQGHWTYADWEALPDDGNRYEVIDGVLYMTTAPSNFHQWIIKRLERYIGIPAEDAGLAYAFPAPIGLIMPGCDPVQPDYVVILQSNAAIIADRRIRGVPNIIVEVQSPSNSAYDERVKLVAYAMAGVPEYAIVDPRARTLSHYRLDALGRYEYPRTFGEGQTMTFDCLPTLPLAIADLFAGAPDTTP
jgi:Uma2 family endonuclease